MNAVPYPYGSAQPQAMQQNHEYRPYPPQQPYYAPQQGAFYPPQQGYPQQVYQPAPQVNYSMHAQQHVMHPQIPQNVDMPATPNDASNEKKEDNSAKVFNHFTKQYTPKGVVSSCCGFEFDADESIETCCFGCSEPISLKTIIAVFAIVFKIIAFVGVFICLIVGIALIVNENRTLQRSSIVLVGIGFVILSAVLAVAWLIITILEWRYYGSAGGTFNAREETFTCGPRPSYAVQFL